MFYIYILYSPTFDKYYLGHSSDPFRRLVEHNTSPYYSFTFKFRPWEIKALFQCGCSRAKALEIERFIKKQKSRNLFKRLIDPDFVPSGILAELVRVPHLRD